MKKVYSADNLPMSGYIKSLLESCEIECVLKNQNLAGAMGELPPIECWPEVWVLDDEDYDDALRIVNSAISDADSSNESWLCPCGERIEGQFRICWACGHEQDK